ncbi:hypothetical protein BHE97_08165 [Aeromicrobium sp. PE09-221]|nr:hypothetical protein BHE97_08165 [Aeromicrobium sp. PE09-221]
MGEAGLAVVNRRKAVRQEETAEVRLERAALRILERDGVLAGLNLREVADEAKVTRGLVYHHFGDRRSFLRSAIERSTRRRRSTVLRREKLPARARLESYFASTMSDPSTVRLITLLLLDGDEGFNALPYAQITRKADQRDVEAGLLADDLSVDSLQAGLLAALYGWALFRESFAASLGRTPDELDDGVLEMLHRMWEPEADRGEPSKSGGEPERPGGDVEGQATT